MIVPGRAHLGHILKYVGRPLILLFAWDVAVTAAYYFFASYWVQFPALPLTLLGSAVAVYLSFRNTTAYARWWEARTLWGSMVNSSRTFAREVATLLPTGTTNTLLVHRHIAYVQALRMHLRRQTPWDELAARLPGDELARLRDVANVPQAILSRTASMVRATGVDDIRHVAIENTFAELTNAQGGLERIKNTPLPQQYATYPALFTHAFCILLPLGMVEALGLYTPLGSTAVGFLFLALLQIGNDMQNPFENTENDVPMTAITRGIEVDLRDALGEAHGLEPVAIEGGVLW
ncbi:putative membrane protein [Luteibacter rhizovicinus]|uniref:Putative membrane protein n=1 Tax=Luteibacter rhizovicinus TaxID=242606 RepID=A0A4R3YSX3_9GAMM|nr:bestrophin family ion channel [Luteibacter rhizovicinus]TCV94818.1 putative membrane protein [Luteibacter rhizovicinus]